MKSEELALLERFVDDRMLPGDVELVNELLVEDEQFRSLFVQYLDLHNNLSWVEPVADTQVLPSEEIAGSSRPRIAWWALAAAAVIVVAGVVGHRQRQAPMQTAATAVAPTMNGRISLPSGKSTLQLANGTKLEVVGPADLEIMPDQSVDLLYGRVGVELPPGVNDFRMRTPVVEIVDLGTAFLAAASNERTVVAVRQGAVRIYSGSETVDMVAGTSATFHRGEGVSRFPLDLEDQDYLEQAFVAGVSLNTGVETAPVRLSGAARWVDPDQISLPTSKLRDDDVVVCLDRQSWTLPEALPVRTDTAGFLDTFEGNPGTVAAGTRVDLYRLVYAPLRKDRGLASLEFPTQVLGVVATTESLAKLDAMLGREPMPILGRGLESREGNERNHDAVNLARNRRIATIAMAVSNVHRDEVVVIVESPTKD